MSEKKTTRKQTRIVKKVQTRVYERFHWAQRLAHALLLTCFSLLGITGLPQKFATSGWAQAMIKFFGGIESTRLIHHAAAIVLIILAIYHALDMGYKIFVRRVRLTMLPGIKDITDALQAFRYNIGLRKSRPQMSRYTFEEKAEYWALIWGTVIMAITGFIMWNPITSTRLFPGEVIPAAKAAHGGEALLAVMAIVVWHMYHVHIKRFNKAMFTGKQSEDEMLHDHPIELADLKAGIADRPVDPKILRKRQAVYYPIAAVLAVAMLFGVYGFIGGEKTAITALPTLQGLGPVYVPQTPTPVPTNAPASTTSGALTWDGTIGPLLQAKCTLCHGATTATKGLSFASYADAMRGGQDGAVIVAGNPDNSKLVQVQSGTGHPGQLTTSELTMMKNWISAGAPEK